jgi:hypothetical protein
MMAVDVCERAKAVPLDFVWPIGMLKVSCATASGVGVNLGSTPQRISCRSEDRNAIRGSTETRASSGCIQAAEV